MSTLATSLKYYPLLVKTYLLSLGFLLLFLMFFLWMPLAFIMIEIIHLRKWIFWNDLHFFLAFFLFPLFEEINRVLMSPKESSDKSKMSTTEMSASLQDSDSITSFLCPSWRWASYASSTAKWLKHKCVCSVMFGSLWPHGLQPARLPGPWNFKSRILEWVTISYSRDLPDIGVEFMSPVFPSLSGRLFTSEPPGNYWLKHKWSLFIDWLISFKECRKLLS